MRVRLALFTFAASWLLSCGGSAPATLEFVEISPEKPRLGEITTVKFRAIDNRGMPQAGVQVTFELASAVPGVTLGPAMATTNKGDGIASTQLTISSRVSSVVVVAKAEDKQAQSPAVSFAGSVPNARQLTFQCGPVSAEGSGGIHAIGAYDETRSLIAGVRLTCTAHVGDRNGDGVAGALVSFLTEAGTIGPTESTASDGVGNATVLYKTSLPLPRDVPPGTFSWTPAKGLRNTGEYLAPLWMQPFMWVANPITQFGQPPTGQEPRRADPIRPNVINNPRDNLVALVAFTAGEEAFDDLDNDGKWDDGEPFVDLTEPFVDDNDNGSWDQGERYIDANGNGEWDGKNERWDASTLIWVQERILWTGLPHALDMTGPEPIFRIVAPATPPSISHFGVASAAFLLSDPWYNSIAANETSDGCSSGESPLVRVFPESVRLGIPTSYPATTRVDFLMVDAHDPKSDPPEPAFSPLKPFTIPLTCSFTGSRIDGHKVAITVTTLSGLVE